MACIGRTIEDAKILVHHAKLTPDELLPTTQTLEFSSEFGQLQGVLLEMDSKLLNCLLEGERIVLRGEEDDAVVMCTKGKTYEVREAEISNSLVMIPNMKLPDDIDKNTDMSLHNCQVNSIHYTYMEMKPCKPRLSKLRQFLSERPYGGPNEDDISEDVGKRYTEDDLLNIIQCSEDELQVSLTDMEAYHIHGHWQILDFDYRFKVVSHILNLIDEQKYSLDRIPREATIKTLSALEPKAVITQCFDYYLKSTDKKDDNGDELCSLLDDNVCRLCAEVLLKPAGKFNLTEFLTIWQQSVPEGLSTSLSQLEGVALVDRSSSPETIEHYPVYNLPEDLNFRFSGLFEKRDKWTLDEIRPYVQDLATDKLPVNAILTKYARASTQNGIKYYTGKHSR
ncbi:unnamed protein product [Meganyctiphanes norvegica]|uniref:Sister chromatid cohesion protein DCC1 n=1 Tax=Meganyctiphanes norvegica TaxID=48144 RepID=A0AAV2QKR2_MEGNR